MRHAHTPAISALRTGRFTRFVVVPLTLVALFSGCYKWSTPAQSPADFIRAEEPSTVRLYFKGRQVTVHDPAVTNGHISFFVNDTLRTVRSDEVSYIEYRKVSAFGIVGPVVAGGLVVLGIVAWCNDWGC